MTSRTNKTSLKRVFTRCHATQRTLPNPTSHTRNQRAIKCGMLNEGIDLKLALVRNASIDRPGEGKVYSLSPEIIILMTK